MPRDLKVRLLIAFLCVYLIWGSTYLGIRYAIETIPPFLMGGVRFVIAGTILMTFSRARGLAWPNRKEWRIAAVVGTLLLLGGNGGVVWAEVTVPSALTALIAAAVPIVTVALDWLRPGGTRPGKATMIGLVTGFAGVALLINPFTNDAARVDPFGAALLLISCVSWAAGSLYGRYKPGAAQGLMGAGANMLTGGAGMLAVGLLKGETAGFSIAAISSTSWVALLYLIFIGAIVGFSAYFYLMHHTTPAKSTTNAYVNPIVAIILGSVIAHEPITPRIMLAAAIIIAGVVMITTLPHLRSWVQERRLARV